MCHLEGDAKFLKRAWQGMEAVKALAETKTEESYAEQVSHSKAGNVHQCAEDAVGPEPDGVLAGREGTTLHPSHAASKPCRGTSKAVCGCRCRRPAVCKKARDDFKIRLRWRPLKWGRRRAPTMQDCPFSCKP